VQSGGRVKHGEIVQVGIGVSRQETGEDAPKEPPPVDRNASGALRMNLAISSYEESYLSSPERLPKSRLNSSKCIFVRLLGLRSKRRTISSRPSMPCTDAIRVSTFSSSGRSADGGGGEELILDDVRNRARKGLCLLGRGSGFSSNPPIRVVMPDFCRPCSAAARAGSTQTALWMSEEIRTCDVGIVSRSRLRRETQPDGAELTQ